MIREIMRPMDGKKFSLCFVERRVHSNNKHSCLLRSERGRDKFRLGKKHVRFRGVLPEPGNLKFLFHLQVFARVKIPRAVTQFLTPCLVCPIVRIPLSTISVARENSARESKAHCMVPYHILTIHKKIPDATHV